MLFNKEPAVIINGVSALAQQILPLLIVVGIVHLAPEKLAGYISIIGLVSAFVSTTLIRSQVVSPETNRAEVQKAIDTPKGTATVEDIKNAVANEK